MGFPDKFIWGAAAASYQIEGSTQSIDGGAESVWDMCCRREDFVKAGDTGFEACDHYRRFREDIALMKQIGLQAYRLSIMWPRVIPQGTGQVNEKGLAFYDELIDGLLAEGIQPWVTLFHWDYPLALFHKGGWLNEQSSDWFAEYTQVLVERFSDRVQHWFTLNEQACFIGLGHQVGRHAPGLQLSTREVNRAWHNALLAHGKAVQVIRSQAKKTPYIGAAPCFSTAVPASEKPEDIAAAREFTMQVDSTDMFNCTWWMDPAVKGQYPQDGMELFGEDAPEIKDGDMETIAQPIDFIGFNIYNSSIIKAGQDGKPEIVEHRNDSPKTYFQWPITPESIRWGATFLHERYQRPIYVTENGLSLNDWVSLDGKVHDPKRIDFLSRYLLGLRQAIADGVDIRGYFQWSIMDNFEWAEGYSQRFGLVFIDYPSQRRIIKDSGYWYGELIKSNGGILGEHSALSHWPDN